MQQLRPLYPRLWRYCLVLTGNRSRADDLAQSACLRALEKSDQLGTDDRLDGWIFRIAQRIWLNELRAESVRRGGGMASIDEIEITDHRPDPETNLLAREVLLEVMALPEAQRATVVLVYVDGYSYKEAAEILDIPIGTVMSRLAAARGKLSTTFEHKKSNTG
ncbi:MAG: RNA polymerase sigma factor [Hyphomicrobiaceae bacterium]